MGAILEIEKEVKKVFEDFNVFFALGKPGECA